MFCSNVCFLNVSFNLLCKSCTFLLLQGRELKTPHVAAYLSLFTAVLFRTTAEL